MDNKKTGNIESWYAFYEPNHLVIPMAGEEFDNDESLKDIKKLDDVILLGIEGRPTEIIVSKEELLDERLDIDSSIRKTIRKYFKDNNFILTNTFDIKEGENGKITYLVIVENEDIKLIKWGNAVYEKLPFPILEGAKDLANEVAESLDPSFASSYAFEIVMLNDNTFDVKRFMRVD